MAVCDRCGRQILWRQSKSSGRWYAVTPSSGRPHHLSCTDARSLKVYWAERKRSEEQLNRQI